mmetsp:Transcript_20198/g.56268  ORF Transcript_20198/g.56268 Transcript_20198/m.56268 type:complete len:89 (+) Transcript_20198:705-971(+)
MPRSSTLYKCLSHLSLNSQQGAQRIMKLLCLHSVTSVSLQVFLSINRQSKDCKQAQTHQLQASLQALTGTCGSTAPTQPRGTPITSAP